VAIEAGGIPLAVLPAPANHRDDGLLAATLDAAVTVTAAAVGPLPATLTVHLDAGYDYQTARQVLAERGMVGQLAARGVPAPSSSAVGSRVGDLPRKVAWTDACASPHGLENAEGTLTRRNVCDASCPT
jgi:hypothetical protein